MLGGSLIIALQPVRSSGWQRISSDLRLNALLIQLLYGLIDTGWLLSGRALLLPQSDGG